MPQRPRPASMSRRTWSDRMDHCSVMDSNEENPCKIHSAEPFKHSSTVAVFTAVE